MNLNEISNTLTNNQFILSIDGLDHVNFTIQSCILPEISTVSNYKVNNQRGAIYGGGGNLQIGDLELRFIVDRDLKNYMEILDWLLMNRNENLLEKRLKDGFLYILTGQKNYNFNIKFSNLSPTLLSGLEFDTTTIGNNSLKCTAKFSFTSYDFDNTNTMGGT